VPVPVPMSAFGESRVGCKYKRQTHGGSGCGPKNLLVVTIKSGHGAVLDPHRDPNWVAELDRRHLRVRSQRERGALEGHEGHGTTSERGRE
jgi:hypothetical protein